MAVSKLKTEPTHFLYRADADADKVGWRDSDNHKLVFVLIDDVVLIERLADLYSDIFARIGGLAEKLFIALEPIDRNIFYFFFRF